MAIAYNDNENNNDNDYNPVSLLALTEFDQVCAKFSVDVNFCFFARYSFSVGVYPKTFVSFCSLPIPQATWASLL